MRERKKLIHIHKTKYRKKEKKQRLTPISE